jgi:hypothetical protein
LGISFGHTEWSLVGFNSELALVHEVNETNAQAADHRRNSVELRYTRRF